MGNHHYSLVFKVFQDSRAGSAGFSLAGLGSESRWRHVELFFRLAQCSYLPCSYGKHAVVRLGYSPHSVTVYIRGPMKGYIYPYSTYYPTVAEGGQYPRYVYGVDEVHLEYFRHF